MKIIYNDPELKTELEKIREETKIEIELEHRISAEQSLREFIKKYKGPPVGFAPPPGLVDLGKYAISFVFSEPVAQGIIGTAIWEAMKKSYELLRRKKEKPEKEKRELVVLTDQCGVNGACATIYFIISSDAEEVAFEEAIRKIPEVRARLLSLLDIVSINPTIELNYNYFLSKWELPIFISTYNPEQQKKYGFFQRIRRLFR